MTDNLDVEAQEALEAIQSAGSPPGWMYDAIKAALAAKDAELQGLRADNLMLSGHACCKQHSDKCFTCLTLRKLEAAESRATKAEREQERIMRAFRAEEARAEFEMKRADSLQAQLAQARAEAFEEAAEEAAAEATEQHRLGQHIAANAAIDITARLRGKVRALRQSVPASHEAGECGKKIMTPSSYWYCPRPLGHKGVCGLKVMPDDAPGAASGGAGEGA